MIAARRASWEASKRRSTLKSNKKRPPLLLRRSRGTEYALKLPDIKDRPGSMMRGSRVLVSIEGGIRDDISYSGAAEDGTHRWSGVFRWFQRWRGAGQGAPKEWGRTSDCGGGTSRT